jgi:hypothetical protein
MPYVQFKDQRFPLTAAELTIGAYEGAGVRLPGDDPAVRAVLRVGADGTGIVRRDGPDSAVSVNGVRLGAEPSPLLHGDRLAIGSHELRYGDEAGRSGLGFLPSVNVSGAIGPKRSAPRKPTTSTGGRLVSLVDGREYEVPAGGVTFGRDVANDIVIASTEVSRKHATIAPGEGGYVLSDLSTNGVTVNGERVDGHLLLGRGDVVTIGSEEYRFYADVAKTPAASSSAGGPAAGAPPPAPLHASALAADTGSPSGADSWN